VRIYDPEQQAVIEDRARKAFAEVGVVIDQIDWIDGRPLISGPFPGLTSDEAYNGYCLVWPVHACRACWDKVALAAAQTRRRAPARTAIAEARAQPVDKLCVMERAPSLRQLVNAGATVADIDQAESAVAALTHRQTTSALLQRALSAAGTPAERRHRLACAVAAEAATARQVAS